MRLGAFCLALTMACAGAAAHAAVITFDEPGVTGMPNTAGTPVPAASQLSTFYLNTLGASFSSGAGYVAVVDHIHNCGAFCTPSPPDIIGGTSASGNLDYSVPINVAFFDPANTSTVATTDFVKVLGDLIGLGHGTVTLQAFDSAGNLIATDTDTDDKPQGQGPVLSISAPGIHSVSFFSDNDTVGFDNFEFGTLSPVPEPASWALMIAGFGAIGCSLRRRRSQLRIA